MEEADNFDIKEIDEIIALEILLNSYNIDAVQLGKKKIRYIIFLLHLALKSTKTPE